MEKVDNMQEQMHNVGREIENLRKNKKRSQISKSLQQKLKMPLRGSLLEWILLRKESLSLRIPQYKLIEISQTEKQRKKYKTENPSIVGQLQKA